MKPVLFALALGILLLAGCTLPWQQAPPAQQPAPQPAQTGGMGYQQQPAPQPPALIQPPACEEYATYAKGELNGVYGTYRNTCDGSDLKAYFCRGGVVAEEIVRCGWNCYNDECVHRREGFCVDSNEKDDQYRRGETKMTVSTSVMERVVDRCASPTTLYEYYCSGGDIVRKEIACTCAEGECVR